MHCLYRLSLILYSCSDFLFAFGQLSTFAHPESLLESFLLLIELKDICPFLFVLKIIIVKQTCFTYQQKGTALIWEYVRTNNKSKAILFQSPDAAAFVTACLQYIHALSVEKIFKKHTPCK